MTGPPMTAPRWTAGSPHRDAFLPPAAALAEATVAVDGDEQARTRPLGHDSRRAARGRRRPSTVTRGRFTCTVTVACAAGR
ncbi:hypothetical protein GS831_13505 [Rhodococcus hoagii]|nr:hypothetical protein [Prescottella equi]